MIKFISEHSGMLFAKTFEHLYISIVALVIAMIGGSFRHFII